MTALSVSPAFPIFTDRDGQPLENGYVWIGAANLPPQTNPIAVFWDAALSQPATQPVRTINGYPSNSGSPGRLYVGSDYSLLVQDAKGSLVYSAPASTERFGDISSSEVVFVQAGAGAANRTIQDKAREFLSVKDRGAVGNGIADDTAAIQLAINESDQVYFPPGTYRITSSLLLSPNKNIFGAGRRETLIVVDAAVYGVSAIYSSQTTLRADIRDMSFQGTAGALGAMKFQHATRVRVDSCDFYDFTASGALGIEFARVYHWWVSNCGFENIHSNGVLCSIVDTVSSNHGMFGPNNDVIGNNQANHIGLALYGTQNVMVLSNNFEGSNNGNKGIDLQGVEGVFIVQNYIELWLASAIAGNAGGSNKRVTIEQNAIQASTPNICNFNNVSFPNDRVAFRSNRFLDAIGGQTCVVFGTTLNAQFQDNDPASATPTDLTSGNAVSAQVLYGSKTWDPGNIANLSSANDTVTVTGASVGDVCSATLSTIGSRNMLITAHVQATDTVRVVLFNNEGATVDLPSGTLRVKVSKQ
jgi:hypothetical protein